MKISSLAAATAIYLRLMSAIDFDVRVPSRLKQDFQVLLAPRSSEVIASFYGTAIPDLNSATSTSLASALYALSTAFDASPSAWAGLIYAAPPKVQTLIADSGFAYATITAETWYKDVAKPAQTVWAAQQKDMESAAEEVVGKMATKTETSTAVTPKVTVMAVAGVVGVLGGVLAAL
jgi:hypothetical protein